jgi:hypothetical protein
MATAAQIIANRNNAQLSTGPKSEEGKAVVAQNRLSHGLSSKSFALLPVEDPGEWETLLNALADEHRPDSPTASFLVTELARAQWKLNRVLALEAELLATDASVQSNWAAIARQFREDCTVQEALLKLNRYEQSARRAWHKALEQLLKLRAVEQTSKVRAVRARHSNIEARMREIMTAPVPFRAPLTENFNTKPMPGHLQRELEVHRRRDPLFDPGKDASQMSKELRKWFSRQ